jgi:tRNA dimethylallyltransferase
VVATTIGSKIIAILGPTASGKTHLALDLAVKYNGEIICADSRTIYRGMDIGTAKPTAQEQERVRHHLLDIVDPGESLSAAAFKTLAGAAINDVLSRGKVPFLVGGSGLYIDAVLYDYQFPGEANPDRRAELEAFDTDELRELLAAADPEAFERVDLANRRRIIRAIETAGQAVSRLSAVGSHVLVLGLRMSKKVAHERIARRIQKMLEEGFIEEVRRIGETYGWDSPAMTVIGYKAFKDVAVGKKTIGDGAIDFARGDMALYKKQMTWFRRNQDIKWLEDSGQAERLVRDFLKSGRV